MAYEAHILLGRITKTVGYEGFVVVRLEKKFIGNYKEQKSVFLEIEGKPTPFFISDYEFSGGDILKLQFDGYETADAMSEFVGANVFLVGDEYDIDNEASPDFLMGFSVQSTQGKHIGIVDDILENTAQYLLSVKTPDERTVLLPLHDDLIENIDEENSLLVMEIPDGLTDL